MPVRVSSWQLILTRRNPAVAAPAELVAALAAAAVARAAALAEPEAREGPAAVEGALVEPGERAEQVALAEKAAQPAEPPVALPAVPVEPAAAPLVAAIPRTTITATTR